MTIRARLRKGETLRITFSDRADPRELNLEGWGEVRLKFDSHEQVSVEMLPSDPASRR